MREDEKWNRSTRSTGGKKKRWQIALAAAANALVAWKQIILFSKMLKFPGKKNSKQQKECDRKYWILGNILFVKMKFQN
jgi:hypothetical protein